MDDRDVRVLLGVLGEQLVGVAEVVEGRDGQFDLLVGVGRGGAAAVCGVWVRGASSDELPSVGALSSDIGTHMGSLPRAQGSAPAIVVTLG